MLVDIRVLQCDWRRCDQSTMTSIDKLQHGVFVSVHQHQINTTVEL